MSSAGSGHNKGTSSIIQVLNKYCDVYIYSFSSDKTGEKEKHSLFCMVDWKFSDVCNTVSL